MEKKMKTLALGIILAVCGFFAFYGMQGVQGVQGVYSQPVEEPSPYT